jgi:hypothetical protein
MDRAQIADLTGSYEIPGSSRWKAGGQASNYRIVCGSRFQGHEDGVEAEARVGSNPQLADVGRNIGEAGV